MSNWCGNKNTLCEYANNNGYCSVSACLNRRLYGNTIQEEKTQSNWQTGTPTEEGWYLVAYKKRDCDGSYYWEYGARVWIEIIEGEGHWDVCQEKHPVIAWQRIEPYEEAENGNA